MKPQDIRKNKRLIHYSELRQIVIENKVNAMPKNKRVSKKKDENKPLFEFLKN